jgi:hypothetical protein
MSKNTKDHYLFCCSAPPSSEIEPECHNPNGHCSLYDTSSENHGVNIRFETNDIINTISLVADHIFNFILVIDILS